MFDQSGADSLPILAFWTYNITILIHLIQSDPGLLSVCEQRRLLEMLREMLNSMQGEEEHVVKEGKTALIVLSTIASTHHSLHGRQNAPDPGSVHARLRNHRGGCAV